MFVEVMILLLRHKSDMNSDRPDIDDFVEESAAYLGKAYLFIPDEVARISLTDCLIYSTKKRTFRR